MNTTILSIYITKESLTAVVIDKRVKTLSIKESLNIPLDQDAKDDFDAIKQAVRTLETTLDIKMDTKKGGVKYKTIVSIPLEMVYVRNIKLPFKDSKNIAKVLPFELESMILSDPTQLQIDFQSIGDVSDKNSSENTLLVAMINRSELNIYKELFKAYNPSLISISGYVFGAGYSCFNTNYKQSVFLDIGNTHVNLCIVLDKPAFIRPFALNPNNPQDSICFNIKQTIYAFEEIIDETFTPNFIIVTGAGVSNLDIEYISQKLYIKVKKSDLNFNIEKGSNNLSIAGALYFGLAQYKSIQLLNFAKKYLNFIDYFFEYKKQFISMTILLIMIFITAFSTVFIDYNDLKKANKNLDTQIQKIFSDTFPDVKTIIDPFQQMQSKIKETKIGKTGLIIQSPRVIDVLNSISQNLSPDIDVEFTRFVMGANKLLILGFTDTFNSVDNIKSKLEKAENIFKTVTISSANMDKDNKRIRFQLKIEL